MNRLQNTVRLLAVTTALALAAGCNYSSDRPHVLGQEDGGSIEIPSETDTDTVIEGDGTVVDGGGTTGTDGGGVVDPVDPSEPVDPVADVTPPTVIGTSPNDQATGVSANTAIRVTFSEDIDASTLTSASFLVYAGPPTTEAIFDQPVNGTIGYDPATATVTFTPAQKLPAGKGATVFLTEAIKDKAGNALVVHAFHFTVKTLSIGGIGPVSAIDLVPPAVVSATPAQNASGVISGIIEFTFSEAIDATTLNHETIHIYHGLASDQNLMPSWEEITGFVVANSQDPKKLVLASYDVSALTNAKVVIQLGTGVKDLAGNGLSEEYLLVFTTE